MSKCPNCGQETMRTEDWACQWCGYPLPVGPFKKIDKTYRQLKEERRCECETAPQVEPEPECEPEIELKQDLAVIKAIDLEVELVGETVGEEEPQEVLKAGGEPEPEIECEPEAEKSAEPEAEPEEVKAETCEETEEVKEPVCEVEEEKEEPEPEVELCKPEPEPPDMELSVEEILAAYQEDDAAADEKFAGKVLRVTGVVAMIDIKERLDTHYIRLAAGEGDFMQDLQCMFDKKYAPALRELDKGQQATVQGRYNGSLIAMRIVDCVLID